MSDIRTRRSVGKDAEIRRRILSKLENEPDLKFEKLAENCQRIVCVRKDSKNIKKSGVANVKKVKHRSKSYSPVKERKNMISQNFNTCKLVSTKKKQKTQRLLPLWKSTLGQGLSLSYKKNVKTAINLDISARSVETEK